MEQCWQLHIINFCNLKCKWHENFIVLSESPLKVRKIAVYCFLISFPVPDSKNDPKHRMKNAWSWSWVESIKIDKISDVIRWTSDSKQSLNILCLGKYLSKPFETLEGKIKKKHFAKDLWKNLVVIVMMLVPGSFNGYREMKHNSAITCQNQLRFWNEKATEDFDL